MKKAKAAPPRADALRRRAEERLRTLQAKGVSRLSVADAQRLVHELEVHQIELAMQNDELRAARVETEAALHRYTELFDFAPIGYATLDPDDTIRELNHAGAQLLGCDRSQLIGVRFAKMVSTPDRPTFAALVVRARSSEKRETCELEVAGGGPRSIGLRLSASVIPGSQPTMFIAFEDNTERKRAHDVLYFLGETSHQLASSLDPGEIAGAAARLAVSFIADLAVVDILGEKGSWQRAGLEHRDSDLGLLFADMVPGFTLLPCVRDAARAAEKNGEAQLIADLRHELEGRRITRARRDLVRELRLASCLVVPLVSSSRLVGMLTLVRRDQGRVLGTSDLPLATEFGRRVASMLENSLLHGQVIEAGRTKDEFLAMVSHELRTPLAAVLMWARALRSTTEPVPRERALDAIEGAVRLQSRLVEDLVDLARSFAGKLSLSLGAVDVEDAVAQAIDTERPAAAARRLTIHVERVRPCGTVWADVQRLVQIVTNLLSNAIKYSTDGGRIAVRLDSDGDDIVVAVRDNGLGISAELLPVVFEPFRRGDDLPEERGAGLGLGLAVVKQLTEMHGGSVAAASAGRGRGAEFTVRLPRLGQPDGQRTDEGQGGPAAARGGDRTH